jgi:aryl-alcohol dehydrogenase-like predicted oxidoreductase
LTGKYTRESVSQHATGNSTQALTPPGRLNVGNPFQGPYTKFTARNWNILSKLMGIASAIARPPWQVALAWALSRPGISSLILGANSVDQLQGNLTALSLNLSDDQLQVLNTASELDLAFPYGLMTPAGSRMIFGGCDVQGWSR